MSSLSRKLTSTTNIITTTTKSKSLDSENERNEILSINDCYKYLNNGCEYNPSIDSNSELNLEVTANLGYDEYYFKTSRKEFKDKLPNYYSDYLVNEINNENEDTEQFIDLNNVVSGINSYSNINNIGANELIVGKKRSRIALFNEKSISDNSQFINNNESDKKSKSELGNNNISSNSNNNNSQNITTATLKRPSISKTNLITPTLNLDTNTNTLSTLDSTNIQSLPINSNNSNNNKIISKINNLKSNTTQSISVLDSILKLSNSISNSTDFINNSSNNNSSSISSSISNNNIFSYINQDIDKQINENFKKKLIELQKLPRYYKKIGVLDMSIQTPLSTDPILSHKETVLELGKCLYFDKIPSNTEINIQRVYFDCGNSLSYWDKKSMPSLSDDPYVKEIIEKRNVDIVMSSSSFIKFINNHSQNQFQEEWDIPVILKEFDITIPNSNNNSSSGGGGDGNNSNNNYNSSNLKSSSTISSFSSDPACLNSSSSTSSSNSTFKKFISIIEKPILKRRITNREKNEKFFNIAIESLGLTNNHPSIEYSKMKYKINESSSSSSSSQNHQQQKLQLENHLKKTNLTYNIWEFGGIRILIRCKIHGHITDPTHKFRCIGLKSKIEYRVDKGLEEITVSDTSKWWAYTFIRPDAHLLLSRINIWNNRVLSIEKKDMLNILNHKFSNFNPLNSSKITFEILKKIKSISNNSSGGNNSISGDSNENSSNNSSSNSSGNNNKYLILSHIPHDNFIYFYNSINETDKDSDTFDLQAKHSSVPIVVNENSPPPLIQILSKPSQLPSYCYSFADTGVCTKTNCGFAHLSKAKIKEFNNNSINNNNNNNNPKNKKNKKKNKKKSNNVNESMSDINYIINNNI